MSAFAIREGFGPKVIKDLTKFNGRKPGEPGHYESGEYLISIIKSLNGVKEVSWAPGFFQEFTFQKIPHRNIVFLVKGITNKPKIIIFAHYDHLGFGFPGANDNGSGLYGALQIAKRITERAVSERPLYDILFVFSDGEESEMQGSNIISNRYPTGNIVINIDTIGGYPNDKPIQITNCGNYEDYLLKKADAKNMNIIFTQPLLGRSDIGNFLDHNTCLEFGYPTKDGEYHSTTDTYENLHLKNMNKVIDLAGDLVEDISYGLLRAHF
jgi:Zn-dependent M28 family amino/carboxypeptidase